jgi:hypothetical protein
MHKAMFSAFSLLLCLGACEAADNELVPPEETYGWGSSLAVLGDQAVVGENGTLHFFERELRQWYPGTVVRFGDPEFAYASSVPRAKFCGPDRVAFSHSSMSGLLARVNGSWVLEQQFSDSPLEVHCTETIVVAGTQTFLEGEAVGIAPGQPLALTADGRLVSRFGGGIAFHILRDGVWSSLGSIPSVFPTWVAVEDALVVLVDSSGSLRTYKQIGSGWTELATRENPERWSRPTLAKGLLVGLVDSGTQEFVTALRHANGDWVAAEGESRAFLATDRETPEFGTMAFDGDTLLLLSFGKWGRRRVESYDLR